MRYKHCEGNATRLYLKKVHGDVIDKSDTSGNVLNIRFSNRLKTNRILASITRTVNIMKFKALTIGEITITVTADDS